MADVPPILKRLVDRLKLQGMEDAAARNFAVNILTKSGSMSEGRLTPLGKVKQAKGDHGRAQDRAAARMGVDPNKLTYNARTNHATARVRGRDNKFL